MKREDMLCRVSGVLLKCADLIFAALFAFVVVGVTRNTQSMIPGSIGRYITMCFLWIILVGCCVFLWRKFLRGKDYKRRLLLVAFALQAIYVWAVYSQVDSDAYVITYIAYHFVQGDLAALEGFWREYLAVYTNNIPATAVLTAVFTVWMPDTLEQAWLLLSMIAAMLSDIAILFIFKLVKTVVGETAAIVAMALAIALISLSEPSTILYSDIMALWTTPAALYAITRGRMGEKRYIGAAGALLAIGSWIKPQSLIVTIAVGIMLILEWMGEPGKEQRKLVGKRGALLVGCFLIVLLGLSTITNAAVNLIGKEYVEQNEMPAIHFVAMGLNPETNGAYSEDDVVDMKSTVGHEAKMELCRSKISARLKDMGLLGFLKHIDGKLVHGAGNGTFTTAREWRGILLNESLQAVRIQNWTVIYETKFQEFTSVWVQCGYLFMLVLSLHSVIYALSAKRRETEPTQWFLTHVCRMTMIGTVLMLVVLERNLRYMYAVLPCMIFLTAYDLKKISDELRQKRAPYKNKRCAEHSAC